MWWTVTSWVPTGLLLEMSLPSTSWVLGSVAAKRKSAEDLHTLQEDDLHAGNSSSSASCASCAASEPAVPGPAGSRALIRSPSAACARWLTRMVSPKSVPFQKRCRSNGHQLAQPLKAASQALPRASSQPN
eukprot:g12881.t1